MSGWRRAGIPDYYPMAIAEGEGAGTAYEYFAKERKVRPFYAELEEGARLLIAGIPQKYGFSLDFVRVGAVAGANILVVDEREERLESLKTLIESAGEELFPARPQIDFKLSPRTETIPEEAGGPFDLALSCEVFQRISKSEQSRFLSGLVSVARKAAVFAPNGGNSEHASRSGLLAVQLEDLVGASVGAGRIAASGYVDMPPFPPGLTRSDEQRDQVMESFSQKVLLKGLEFWCVMESFVPGPIKKKLCHIVYVLLESEKIGA